MNTVYNPAQLAAEARQAYAQGDFSAAARSFLAAAQGYAASGADLQAAEAHSDASVALLQAGDAQAALQALETVEQVFSQAGDIRRLGLAVGNRAAALEALDQLEAASTAYEQSADLLKQCGDLDARSYVMQSLSKLQLRRGQQLQALATMQAGFENIPHPSARQKFIRKLLRVPMAFFRK